MSFYIFNNVITEQHYLFISSINETIDLLIDKTIDLRGGNFNFIKIDE